MTAKDKGKDKAKAKAKAGPPPAAKDDNQKTTAMATGLRVL
jgi:hypothetical protein